MVVAIVSTKADAFNGGQKKSR